MLIYQGNTGQFCDHVRENQICKIMEDNFRSRLGWSANPAEIASWQNSLQRVKDLIDIAELKDNMIALEYEVPYNQNRVDCLIFGTDSRELQNIVLIELKQWTKVQALEEEGNFVETYTGGGQKKVAHPSQQAKGYANYLKNFISDFEGKDPLVLFSCAYCHNYTKENGRGLFDPIYEKLLVDYPVFTREDVRPLAGKLKDLLQRGDGVEVFNRFMQSPIKPSQKLLENVSKVIKNDAVFSLINEQIVAKNLIWSKVRQAERTEKKSVIIVHGGPGTGKSVIALNVLAEAAHRRKKVFFACKSKPFLEGLKKLVGKDGKLLFSNLLRFLPSKTKENEIDILLVDEAHRIEKNSNHRFTRPQDKTDMPQIDQLIRSAKTCVFFVDDKQVVRSQEIGKSAMIKEAAQRHGCTASEVQLETQFRCMGSNNYLEWLESLLGYSEDKRTLRKEEIFDFQILGSPSEIYQLILQKENEKPNSARMVAGFCWPWSKALDDNGEFVKDVKIGDFEMPWETHGDISNPPQGYVSWYEWAYRPEGVKQIGCIYTAQGFEFEYVGVIVGKDLTYDSNNDKLAADINATQDPTLKKNGATFESHVKNIYRVLLSRGMKGCYVYFVDKEVEKFFRSRMELEGKPERVFTVSQPASKPPEEPSDLPFRVLSQKERQPFVNCVPLYDLKVAAGKFIEGQFFDGFEMDQKWVKLPEAFRPKKGMFVAQVVGESMNKRIPDGSYCLFQAIPGGTREGKIVLAKHRRIEDPDHGGNFTVKSYHSEKESLSSEAWRHKSIQLIPDSTLAKYKPIVLKAEDVEDLRIIAELVAVLM